MLQDQFRDSSRIENEYRKLHSAWELERSTNPSTGIKKKKINKSEHIQFNLMQLFNGYLDQIWMNSQNMLQCAQAWSNESAGVHNQTAIFTVNILGLHLMKQSLQTRQELFSIVDQFNSASFGNSDFNQVNKSMSCILLDSSIISGQEDFKSDQQIQLSNNLNQHNTSESNDTVERSQEELDGYFDMPAAINTSANSSIISGLNRPIKLTSSPSTPTIGQRWSFTDTDRCANSFSPACNYSKYYPAAIDDNNGDATQYTLSCHFCQEAIPLKKSFSVDNLYSLQQKLLDIATDNEESSNATSELEGKDKADGNSSSYDITSLYYNSNSEEDEEDIMGHELLLAKDDDDGIETVRQVYQMISESNMEDSLKIEIDDDQFYSGSSTSSNGRIELSPASSSFELSKSFEETANKSSNSSANATPNIHAKHLQSKIIQEEGGNRKTTSSTDINGLSTIFSKKIRSAQKRNINEGDKRHHSKKKDNIKVSSSIMRSLSIVKTNGIRNIFSSSHQTCPTNPSH